MNRRTFTGALVGLAAAATGRSADAARSRYFAMESFQMVNGTQPGRMTEWLSKALVPKMTKAYPGPVLLLEAQIAPHVPQYILLAGYSSLADIESTRAKLATDPELKAAREKADTGPAPLFESQANTLLEVTPYSPDLVVAKRDKPRYFELRIYHSPTVTQLAAVHERMAGPEGKVFHRLGINPILFATTIVGANMPCLTYLIPWESLADREKAWNAFVADPEWLKLRQDSIDKHGQLVATNDIAVYKAAAYSPML